MQQSAESKLKQKIGYNWLKQKIEESQVVRYLRMRNGLEFFEKNSTKSKARSFMSGYICYHETLQNISSNPSDSDPVRGERDTNFPSCM